MSGSRVHDLLVIGGGINGAGIACDAAGRGLDVVLCEADDLAGATSSASSKLIHGGLRYLEHYEFSLVRKALAEREVLLAMAPHIAWPMRFILPHAPELRPRWMIRAGLLLYDHLARRRVIPGSTAIRLDAPPFAGLLRPELKHGFAYWDCWVDDARLVVLNARAAAERGASILTRTRVEAAHPTDGAWRVVCRDVETGIVTERMARVIVNAAGPWADHVLSRLVADLPSGGEPLPRLRLVKGSHIVVPRIAGTEDAFILQNGDGRIVFVLPYEENFSLIGTTDVTFDGDPRTVTASEQEIDYLIAATARQLARPPQREDIVHTFSGVRPLSDDEQGKSASAASRDYALHTTPTDGAPAILSVLGGKITTYRRLAETVVDSLAPHFNGLKPAWTARTPLPGGDIAGGDFEGFVADLIRRLPSLPPGLLMRLARRHGTRTERVLDGASDIAALGTHYGHDLYAREVAYLCDQEWARTPEDILWRRTKVGLHLSPEQRSVTDDLLRMSSCVA